MKLIKKLNTMFIEVLLAFVYITVIGLGRIMQYIEAKKESSINTYWKPPEKKSVSWNSPF